MGEPKFTFDKQLLSKISKDILYMWFCWIGIDFNVEILIGLNLEMLN